MPVCCFARTYWTPCVTRITRSTPGAAALPRVAVSTTTAPRLQAGRPQRAPGSHRTTVCMRWLMVVKGVPLMDSDPPLSACLYMCECRFVPSLDNVVKRTLWQWMYEALQPRMCDKEWQLKSMTCWLQSSMDYLILCQFSWISQKLKT